MSHTKLSQTRGIARKLWMGLWVALLVLGVGFRFYHLDYKVYWIDEVNTTLRSLGYTTREVEATLFTGLPFRAADLQAFQQPQAERGWAATWRSLTGSAEHAPLYFLLSRQWVAWFGSTVATWRSVAAILSLCLFPAVYWFCWELFRQPGPGWVAIAWVAVSPLHILYAQEARPYSLLAVMTAVSSASLLAALRTQRWGYWGFYGVTVVIGLYSQLLFGLVAIAHLLYLVLTEKLIPEKGYASAALRRYGIVSLGAIAAFSPWLWVLGSNLATVQRKTASLAADRYAVSDLIDRWFLVLNQMLIDWELAGWNILLVVGAIAAGVILIRHAPRRAWLLLGLLGGVSFLALAIPDVVLGGARSLRVRYLFPSALCLHITLAFAFACAIPSQKLSHRWIQVLLVGLLCLQIASGVITSQTLVWWNKSRPRSSYYQPTAALINQDGRSLIFTQSKVSDLLAWSYWLAPNISLQYLPTTKLPPRLTRNRLPKRPLYLHEGSADLVAALRAEGHILTPVYPANNASNPMLWRIEPGV